jgi:hypothetical protein
MEDMIEFERKYADMVKPEYKDDVISESGFIKKLDDLFKTSVTIESVWNGIVEDYGIPTGDRLGEFLARAMKSLESGGLSKKKIRQELYDLVMEANPNISDADKQILKEKLGYSSDKPGWG